MFFYSLFDFVGRIVTAFEPNAVDDFARILGVIGALFR